MMKIVLALVLMLGSVTALHAMTGAALVAECKEAVRVTTTDQPTNPDMYATGHCIGLVQGVRDTMSMWSYANTTDKRLHISDPCTPDTVKNSEVLKVFLKWADQNPERMNEDASILVAAALKHSYPCRK